MGPLLVPPVVVPLLLLTDPPVVPALVLDAPAVVLEAELAPELLPPLAPATLEALV